MASRRRLLSGIYANLSRVIPITPSSRGAMPSKFESSLITRSSSDGSSSYLHQAFSVSMVVAFLAARHTMYHQYHAGGRVGNLISSMYRYGQEYDSDGFSPSSRRKEGEQAIQNPAAQILRLHLSPHLRERRRGQNTPALQCHVQYICGPVNLTLTTHLSPPPQSLSTPSQK